MLIYLLINLLHDKLSIQFYCLMLMYLASTIKFHIFGSLTILQKSSAFTATTNELVHGWICDASG